MSKITDVLEIMKKLRSPDKGCPWDLEQTMESIVPHTIEEAYELAHAIEQEDVHEIKKELGDLLFQVVFYSQIASEKGLFEFDDIVESLKEKLIRRHPHVFDKVKIHSAQEQSELWESIKAAERNEDTVLSDIPHNMSSLTRAQKIQKRVARLGFDWHSMQDVLKKVEEEISEIHEVIYHDQEKASEELGDLLFVCCNLARWLNQDAEQILRKANMKFSKRFERVEHEVKRSGKGWKDFTLEELEDFWQLAKNDMSFLA